MSLTKKLFLTVGVACLISIFALAIRYTPGLYRSIFSPYLEQKVAGPVTMTQDWKEITPPKPLRAERQVQYVMFDVTTPFKPSNAAYGLILPDGTLVTPEVELIDEYGTIFKLKLSRLGNTGMGYSSEIDLPKDRVYRVIRVRSDKPIQVSRVYWYSYNSWDVS